MFTTFLRHLLYVLFAPWRQEQAYTAPAEVGYAAAVRLPLAGAVAFRQFDGRLLFRW
jgi:hypothetical protein